MKTGKYIAFLIAALFILTTNTAYSQSMLQGEPTQEIRQQADEAVEVWREELALTSKQADLMENKIIEFAMKRQELLQSKMNEEAKTERLKALEISKHRDMRDILTKPQFERYLAIQRQRAESAEDDDGQSGN